MNGEVYNFRKPGRPESGLGQRLVTWLRDGAALVPGLSAKHLPFTLEVSFQGMETATAAEVLGRLADDALGFRLPVAASGLSTLLVLPRPLALVLVRGALGDTASEPPADRELTAVEEPLVEYLVQRLLVIALQETWPGLEPLPIRIGQIERTPRRVRLFGPNESLIVSTFQVKGPFGEMTWQWLAGQKGLLEELGHATEQAAPAAEVDARPLLEAVVRELPVELVVKLGAVDLPLSHLAQLKVGDVVLLNQRVLDPLRASIAGRQKFRVWPCRVGSQQAVRVDSLPEG